MFAKLLTRTPSSQQLNNWPQRWEQVKKLQGSNFNAAVEKLLSEFMNAHAHSDRSPAEALFRTITGEQETLVSRIKRRQLDGVDNRFVYLFQQLEMRVQATDSVEGLINRLSDKMKQEFAAQGLDSIIRGIPSSVQNQAKDQYLLSLSLVKDRFVETLTTYYSALVEKERSANQLERLLSIVIACEEWGAARLKANTEQNIVIEDIETSIVALARYRLAYLYYENNQYEEACAHFLWLTKNRPHLKLKEEELGRLYFYLGICTLKRGLSSNGASDAIFEEGKGQLRAYFKEFTSVPPKHLNAGLKFHQFPPSINKDQRFLYYHTLVQVHYQQKESALRTEEDWKTILYFAEAAAEEMGLQKTASPTGANQLLREYITKTEHVHDDRLTEQMDAFWNTLARAYAASSEHPRALLVYGYHSQTNTDSAIALKKDWALQCLQRPDSLSPIADYWLLNPLDASCLQLKNPSLVAQLYGKLQSIPTALAFHQKAVLAFETHFIGQGRTLEFQAHDFPYILPCSHVVLLTSCKKASAVAFTRNKEEQFHCSECNDKFVKSKTIPLDEYQNTFQKWKNAKRLKTGSVDLGRIQSVANTPIPAPRPAKKDKFNLHTPEDLSIYLSVPSFKETVDENKVPPPVTEVKDPNQKNPLSESTINRLRSLGLSALAVMKLNSPKTPFTIFQSIECIHSCIEVGKKVHPSQETAHPMVCVVGNTGAGKSAFLNFIAGCTLYMRPATNEDDSFAEEVLDVLPVSKGGTRDLVMEIGHSQKSTTFVPEVLHDGGIDFVDSPGNGDNRGPEFSIANAVNTRSVLTKAPTARVVVLIKASSIEADRGQGLTNIIQMLTKLFGHDLQAHKHSILIGVTRAEGLNLANIRRVICNDLPGFEEQIILVDPLRKSKNSLSREQILERIKQMEQIPNPAVFFKTALSHSDMALLNQVAETIFTRVRECIKTNKYTNAGQEFRKLWALVVIDDPHVTGRVQELRRMIVEDVSKIAAHIRSLVHSENPDERKTIKFEMARFETAARVLDLCMEDPKPLWKLFTELKLEVLQIEKKQQETLNDIYRRDSEQIFSSLQGQVESLVEKHYLKLRGLNVGSNTIFKALKAVTGSSDLEALDLHFQYLEKEKELRSLKYVGSDQAPIDKVQDEAKNRLNNLLTSLVTKAELKAFAEEFNKALKVLEEEVPTAVATHYEAIYKMDPSSNFGQLESVGFTQAIVRSAQEILNKMGEPAYSSIKAEIIAAAEKFVSSVITSGKQRKIEKLSEKIAGFMNNMLFTGNPEELDALYKQLNDLDPEIYAKSKTQAQKYFILDVVDQLEGIFRSPPTSKRKKLLESELLKLQASKKLTPCKAFVDLEKVTEAYKNRLKMKETVELDARLAKFLQDYDSALNLLKVALSHLVENNPAKIGVDTETLITSRSIPELNTLLDLLERAAEEAKNLSLHYIHYEVVNLSRQVLKKETEVPALLTDFGMRAILSDIEKQFKASLKAIKEDQKQVITTHASKMSRTKVGTPITEWTSLGFTAKKVNTLVSLMSFATDQNAETIVQTIRGELRAFLEETIEKAKSQEKERLRNKFNDALQMLRGQKDKVAAVHGRTLSTSDYTVPNLREWRQFGFSNSTIQDIEDVRAELSTNDLKDLQLSVEKDLNNFALELHQKAKEVQTNREGEEKRQQIERLKEEIGKYFTKRIFDRESLKSMKGKLDQLKSLDNNGYVHLKSIAQTTIDDHLKPEKISEKLRGGQFDTVDSTLKQAQEIDVELAPHVRISVQPYYNLLNEYLDNKYKAAMSDIDQAVTVAATARQPFDLSNLDAYLHAKRSLYVYRTNLFHFNSDTVAVLKEKAINRVHQTLTGSTLDSQLEMAAIELLKNYTIADKLQIKQDLIDYLKKYTFKAMGIKGVDALGRNILAYVNDPVLGNAASQMIATFPEFKTRYIARFNEKASGLKFVDALRLFRTDPRNKTTPASIAKLEETHDVYEKVYTEQLSRIINREFDSQANIREAVALGKKLAPHCGDLRQHHKDLGRLLGLVSAQWSYLSSGDKYFSGEKDSLMQPHSTQLIGIFCLLGIDGSRGMENQINELLSGQGKSVCLALLITCTGLMDCHNDLVCYNPYLTERDLKAFKKLFGQYLGLPPISYLTIGDLVHKVVRDNFANTDGMVMDLLRGKITPQTFPKPIRRILLIDEIDSFFGPDFYGQRSQTIKILEDDDSIALLDYIWKNRGYTLSVESVLAQPCTQRLLMTYPGLRLMMGKKVGAMLNDVQRFPIDGSPNFSSACVSKNNKIGYLDPKTGSIDWDCFYGYETMFAYFHYCYGNVKPAERISPSALKSKVGVSITYQSILFLSCQNTTQFS